MFLSGRLQLWERSSDTIADAQGQDGTQVANTDQVGIRERFDPLIDAVVPVSTADDSFQNIAMDETKDVVLLLHTEDGSCVPCENMAPYYKRVAQRMSALGIDSVVVARMDVRGALPPSNIEVTTLPTVVLLRAFNKRPPYFITRASPKSAR